MNFAVILAGGRGERFWPLSRAAHPKQFLDLFEGKPLIRHAADRLDTLLPPENILVVTSEALVPATRAALPHLPPENIVGEPFGRDTAAACALATELVAVRAKGPASLAILTADQLMGDIPTFRQTLRDAFEISAARPVIVTIGITPAYPATGFGYIETSSPLAVPGAATGFFSVARFVEKPDAATAAAYVADGKHFWNAGMFVWSVQTFRDALAKSQPGFAGSFAAFAPALSKPDFSEDLRALYGSLGKISVDYAVMEHADNIVMARGTFPWDDVGSWTAVPNHFSADASGNTVLGDAALADASGNIVVSQEKGHLVAVLGAQDLVIVHTPDATLVCPRSAASKLKSLVQSLPESFT